MRKHLLISLIIFFMLGILAIPKFLLVPYLEQEFGIELKKELAAEQVDVTLQTFWGWEPLLGRIPKLDITLKNAVVDELALAKIEISGVDVRFQAAPLWRDREFVYQGAEDLHSELTVTEQALNELYWQEVDPERNLSLTVEPTGVSLEGKIAILNQQLSVRIYGRLEIWQQSNLRFIPYNVEVQETRIPSFLLEALNESYDFALDLSALPYMVEISGIALEDDVMKIKVGMGK